MISMIFWLMSKLKKLATIGTSPPTAPDKGSVWTDSSTNPPTLKVYDGSSYRGVNADTVDGLQASQFVRSDVGDYLNGTYDLTNATLLWFRDTDKARIYLGDYGDNADWLTIEFGDDPTVDRIKFRWSGTDAVYDVAEILSNKFVIHKPLDLRGTSISLTGAGNCGIEIGRTDGNASTPFIDFHSGATTVDYDSRIIASGGTGANGGGTLNFVAGNVQINGNKVWHAGNDGAGSGLDADKLDGLESSQFVRSDVSDTINGAITFTNTVSISKSLDVGAGSSVNTLTVPKIVLNAPSTGWDQVIRSNGIIRLRPDSDNSGDPFIDLQKYDGSNVIRISCSSSPYIDFVGGAGTIDLNNGAVIGIHQLKFKDIPDTGGASVCWPITSTPASDADYCGITGFSDRQPYWYADITSTTKYKMWHSGNDGSGSGLDADLVDGLHASQFIRSDTTDYFYGTLIYAQGAGDALRFDSDFSYAKRITVNDGQGSFNFSNNWSGSNTHIADGGAARITLYAENTEGSISLRVSPNQAAGSAVSETNLFIAPGRITFNGNKVWHAGNDGVGSGLDADLLDGKHAEDFESRFPSGTKMFFASAIPPGWTLDTTFHDKVIRIVNDSSLVGQTGGSWTITGIGSAGGHSHSMASAGYHQHAAPLGEYTEAGYYGSGDTASYARANRLIIEDSWGYDTVTMSGWWIDGNYRDDDDSVPPETDTKTVKRPKTAGAGSHTHTVYSSGSHTHTFDGTWRPSYLNVIMGVKD